MNCKKERLSFVSTTWTWRRKLKKTELTSKKEDEEKLFLQFPAQYVFCKIVCDGQNMFSPGKELFPPPSEFLLKKNRVTKISLEKGPSESLLKKNHYQPLSHQVRLADGSRVVVKLNTFHTVTLWKLLGNFNPIRIIFAWFAKWKEMIFASQ